MIKIISLLVVLQNALVVRGQHFLFNDDESSANPVVPEYLPAFNEKYAHCSFNLDYYLPCGDLINEIKKDMSELSK